MPTHFRSYNPHQDLLLPPNLREWLPEGHLSYFIDEVVESLDIEAFYKPYEGDGRRKAPYDPRMMLKVLIYGYATGVFSSRKLAIKLEEDVAFRLLGAGNFPAHRTLRAFRRRHLEDFKDVFAQVVQIACEVGLISLGTIAIDGTKVKANASKHKAMSYGRMKQKEAELKDEINALCTQAGNTDKREDGLYGEDSRGDELPEELQHAQTRLEKIVAAKEHLEAEQRQEDEAKGRHADDQRKPPGGGGPYKRDFGVPDDKTQSNFTDPECRIMKTSTGFDQCYNGQLAVDADHQLIAENSLSARGTDNGELLPMVAGVEANTGEKPQVVLADAGYKGEANLKGLEEAEIDGYVSLGRKGKDPEEIDQEKHPVTRRMAEKLSEAEGQERYAERKWIVEAANGWIKRVLGFRQFSVRGITAAQGEWDLVCLALNLRRMNPLMVFE